MGLVPVSAGSLFLTGVAAAAMAACNNHIFIGLQGSVFADLLRRMCSMIRLREVLHHFYQRWEIHCGSKGGLVLGIGEGLPLSLSVGEYLVN